MKKLEKILLLLLMAGSIVACSKVPDKPITPDPPKPPPPEPQTELLEPVATTVGRLNISIDPRIELLNVVQTLAGFSISGKPSDYRNRVIAYFADHADSEAVSFSVTLANIGFSYDGPIGYMLCLSQVPELKTLREYHDPIRAGGRKNLEKYQLALKDFAEKSDFASFWESEQDFYEKIVSQVANGLNDNDYIKEIEDYYGFGHNSYNLILSSLANGSNYGPRIVTDNGKYDIYCISSMHNTLNGVPYKTTQEVMEILWHEFGHSFVNPLADEHETLINSHSALFEPIRSAMNNQAYGSWRTAFIEHTIRAAEIRLQNIHIGYTEAIRMLSYEQSVGFMYIGPIIEKFKDYEEARTATGITFIDYFSEFLKVLDDLEVPGDDFNGNINAVIGEDNILIYPTYGEDQQGLKKAKEYVEYVFEVLSGRSEDKNYVLVSDEEALEMSLEDYAIMAYGTLDSNLYLSHYRSTFPFTVENGILTANGKEYDQAGWRFISSFPNPENSQKGMTVYIASDDNHIYGINSVMHGPSDYLVADGVTILDWGFYIKKDGVWSF